MWKRKCLWAAALVALCVTLGPGLALAADSWALVDQTFPTAITWDGSAAVSVDTNNDGDTTWDSTYALVSLEGATATKIDRWGLTDVPVSGTVAPAADYTFDFSIIGPPITTLAYTVPVGPTAAGVITGLDCNWILANTGALITTDTAENSIVVSRFPDEGGAWNYYIEELAGRGPFIVSGFGDGTYRPTADVLRNSMAVYMARALKLDLLPYAGVFPDVVEGSFGALEIEALVRTGIVTGYADGYRPTAVVNRGQMAAYVARGIAGGDEFVPSGPATQTFDDVAPDFGFYKYIEYAVAQGVVTGYAVDNTYRPANNVNRGQMSAFIWRSFMRVSGTPVVLAGPAVSANDPLTTDWIGWTSPVTLDMADPGFAYVGLDAVRLNTNLVGPDDSFDVTFVLLDEGGATEASQVVSLDAAAITAAHDAAMASGDPYLFLSWDIPALDTGGQYSLKVFVTDENDKTWQAGRTANLWVVPTELFEDFEGITQLPPYWTKVGPGAWTVNPVDLGGCNLPQNQGTTIVAPGGENCLTVLPGGVAREDAPGAYSFTWVATPTVDCSGYTTVSLAQDTLVSCFNDYATIDVSNDNGESWTTLWDWGYPDCSDSNDTYPWHEDGDPGTWLDASVVCADPPPDWWGHLTVDLSSVAAGSSQVKVRWTFVSDEAGCGCYGWLTDNVSITGS